LNPLNPLILLTPLSLLILLTPLIPLIPLIPILLIPLSPTRFTPLTPLTALIRLIARTVLRISNSRSFDLGLSPANQMASLFGDFGVAGVIARSPRPLRIPATGKKSVTSTDFSGSFTALASPNVV
jgi:hypothetical protein